MSHSIRVATIDDVPLLTRLVRAAFRTPAERFGLTPENCPKHPSNCEESWVSGAMAEGVEYFMLESDGEPVGCVALERADEEVGYLERLSVQPAHRHRGYGRALVRRVRERADELGLRRLSIALIAEDAELRRWYEVLGFREKQTRTFEHLPFTVLFMDADLEAIT